MVALGGRPGSNHFDDLAHACDERAARCILHRQLDHFDDSRFFVIHLKIRSIEARHPNRLGQTA